MGVAVLRHCVVSSISVVVKVRDGLGAVEADHD